MALLRLLLANPRAAAGLPDLVCWRTDELMLWEVKSPQDQLGDHQRHWLAWMQEHGVPAGELRVDARVTQQRSWWSPGEAPAALPARATLPAAPAPESRQRPRASQQRLELAALAGGLAGAAWTLPLVAGARLPAEASPALAGLALAQEPSLSIERWRGCLGPGAVRGWDRPLQAVVGLAAEALLLVGRRGRQVRQRRWLHLHPGHLVPLLIADALGIDGLVHRSAQVLLRHAGFLVPAAEGGAEPVVVRPEEIGRLQAGGTVDWRALPEEEPPRIRQQAHAWGCMDALGVGSCF